jgi:antitoxin component YwqK of YwqJK toxin-antitoxin module
MPDGKYEEWFEDGALKTQGEYAGGRETGAWTSWHQLPDPKPGEPRPKPTDHTLASKNVYVRGELEGKQLLYHENGQQQLEVIYHTGRREGSWTEWYDSGQVRAIGEFYHDQTHGEVTYWFEDGSPWAINNYFRGKPVGHWVEWDRDGKIVNDKTY